MFTAKYANVDVICHFKKEDWTATNLIYILKFPNGKYYVGQTTCKGGLKQRICGHCHDANNLYDRGNKHKNYTILKYKHLDVFIQHKCTENEDIDFYECFYIELLKNKILNIQGGGRESHVMAEQTKERLQNSLKRFYDNNPESKINLSKKIKQYALEHPKIIKPIECYDKEGIYITTFYTMNDVKKFLGKEVEYKTLWAVCKNLSFYDQKYYLKFKDDNREIIIKKSNPILPPKNIYLYKYTLSGEFVEEIDRKTINIGVYRQIQQSIKNKCEYKDYQYSFEKLDHLNPIKSKEEKQSEALGTSIKQLDKNWNLIKIWPSIASAAKTLNINDRNIHTVLIGNRNFCGGYRWQYA